MYRRHRWAWKACRAVDDGLQRRITRRGVLGSDAPPPPELGGRGAKLGAMTEPYVYLEDQIAGRERFYGAPVHRITAARLEDVEPCFAAMAECLDQGLHLAGYASYELGYGLEPKLAALLPADRTAPLLAFGAFETVQHQPPATFDTGCTLSGLEPAWSLQDYVGRFNRVMDYIRSGDVYQINLTFPMTGTVDGGAMSLYGDLRQRQPVRYGGVVSLGEPTVVTVSPELFFQLDGRRIRVRPMKGTAGRGATQADDDAIARAMQADDKSRAENLMIVDLLRNDVGRVSEIGSVEVTDLFTVETFPTLHQMTSGIEARLCEGIDVPQIFRSLFPCGSVTGAPKIRAMEIIREIESGPRGAYCGAIGYIEPGGAACFNVAIRTLSLFGNNRVVYNVGSAIVSDSHPKSEYEECLLKARIMTSTVEPSATVGALSA